MKKAMALLSVGAMVCFAFCAVAQEAGSSIKDAIVISYTGDYNESIGQEYAYLNEKFGEGAWEPDTVALLEDGGKYYDKMSVVVTATGETKDFYFDITEPYNEMMKQFQ